MAKIGKWIGAGLGFAMLGPIGALLGFFVGSVIDSSAGVEIRSMPNANTTRTGRADFLYSLVILATALMQADGKITRNELDYVRRFFRENFGVAGENEALSLIKDLREKTIQVDQICLQIRNNMDSASRLQLLYFLFGLAKSDGQVCEQEIRLLDRMADLLGVHQASYSSIKAMYYDDLESAYRVLGITNTATDEEVKKAYRKMAREHHPDKVGYMGEDIQKAAEKKFMAINSAYEKIKKQRNMN